MNSSYDAILIVSFGGPESMEDVMPFLENVTRGRNVPRERLVEVAHHYELFNGVSPINAQNREIIRALQSLIDQDGPRLPIYWGNRNWHPFLADTMKQMKSDGVKRAIAFITAAYSSYSSCRQYLEDILKAQTETGEGAPEIVKIRPFFNHPLFVEANSEHLIKTIAESKVENTDDLHVAFTAHSIPVSMASGCTYSSQLSEECQMVAANSGVRNWKLVYQSRSGPPQVPWLGPDILDHIKTLKEGGVKNLIIHPIGFVSDHMEVIYDLDHEARMLCDDLQIRMWRVPCAGTNPKFIEMIRDLILENTEPGRIKKYVGKLGLLSESCPPECCPLGAARPQAASAAPAKRSDS